jgi:hypothetical protein
MRIRNVISEAMRSSWSAKIPTALVAITVAIMCAVVGVTVMRTATARAEVVSRLEAAGSRHITVFDALGIGFLSSAQLEQIGRLTGVERVIGFGNAFDVVNGLFGQGGEQIPAIEVSGSLEDAIELLWGRWPEPGEALISSSGLKSLGLDQPLDL